ncbi:methyltransferase domain-containing protein [Planococcus sp. APC 4015]|nr:methyltransferase domain-containing protein [Planococcus sp. APC 4015]
MEHSGDPAEHSGDPDEHGGDPEQYWEHRYADRMWSGKPNATMVDIVSRLTPGRALDLGCGEGADTIWLAEHGWDATGIDISPTAVARARQAARAAGVTARFVVSDLSEPTHTGTGFPGGLRAVRGSRDAGTAGADDLGSSDDPGQRGDRHPSSRDHAPESEHAQLSPRPAATSPARDATGYDLVTACFFQSPVALDRIGALQRAAALVTPGGRLLVVSHAAPPAWAGPEHVGAHVFVSPTEELAALALDGAKWIAEVASVRTREVLAPDGSPSSLDDWVVLVRRTS